MAVDPAAILRRYHAALNRYDADEVKAFFAEDAAYVSPGLDGAVTGRDNIIAAFSAYFAEHPDQHATDDEVMSTGPLTARALWRLEATSQSTGKPYVRRGVETVSFTAGGLIARIEVEDR